MSAIQPLTSNIPSSILLFLGVMLSGCPNVPDGEPCSTSAHNACGDVAARLQDAGAIVTSFEAVCGYSAAEALDCGLELDVRDVSGAFECSLKDELDEVAICEIELEPKEEGDDEEVSESPDEALLFESVSSADRFIVALVSDGSIRCSGCVHEG